MRISIKKFKSRKIVLQKPGRTLKDAVLFFTGIMTMLHLVIIFPYILYAAAIAGLLAGCILIRGKKCLRLERGTVTYLSWYGALFALILVSLLYTVNTVNPDYVITRCSVIFVLGYITATLVKKEADFITLANGLIAGTVLVIAVCMANEGMQIGQKRIGIDTVGSEVALAGIVQVGYTCAAWRAIFKEKHRTFFVILSVVMLAVIALSGSRRPLLISIMLTILLVVFNPNIRKSRRVLSVLVLALCIVAIFYAIFTNEMLYTIIGLRIESMLTTLLGAGDAVTDASMQERTVMKEYGYELFRQRPFFGYGVHGFAYKFMGYYGKLLYSHCGFSELLSCYGLVGFLIFYNIFIVYIKRGIKVFRTGTDAQILMMVFAALTFISEAATMAFIVPQSIVMLTAGANLLCEKRNMSD